MMLKSKLAVLAGAFILAGSTFAAQQITCPDIEAIKAEGLSMAEEIGPHIFLTYNISTYNTPDTYGFIIAPIQSNTSDDAIESANEILSSMTAPGVPDEHSGAPICTYETGHPNVFAAAIKDESLMSAMKLKQYFLKAHP